MYKVLITGNGFDLSAGMKTSYPEFLKSKFFQEHAELYLFHFLQSASTMVGWVDVELFLKNYALCLSGESGKIDSDLKATLGILRKASHYLENAKSNFFSDFITLKKALVDYLRFQDVEGNLNFHSGLDKYLKNQHSQSPYHAILNFNYTWESLLFLFGLSEDRPEILHLHGSLENNDIVFGVDDNFVDISNDFLFLKKSSHPTYGSFPSLKMVAMNALEMHFYGLSFGQTDDSHFRPLFQFLSSEDAQIPIEAKSNEGVVKDWSSSNRLIRDWNRRKLVFYVYGRDGYLQTRNRLLNLTGQRFSELKLANSVDFCDCSTPNFKMIDQDWLNGHKI